MKSRDELITPVLDYSCAEGFVFRVNTSKHCGVKNTTTRARHEDICLVIYEVLTRALSLPEFGATDNSALGRSPGTSNDGGHSSGAGASYISHCTVC